MSFVNATSAALELRGRSAHNLSEVARFDAG
jgi:hypothetical protein